MNRTTAGIGVAAAIMCAGLAPVRTGAAAQPAADPYQVKTVCTALPVNIGRQVDVATGADLQRALDTAVAGDTIRLRAGVTYRPDAPGGSFIMRNRGVPAGQWIIVRSADSAFDLRGSIRPGTRATETNAPQMPQIRAIRNDAPA